MNKEMYSLFGRVWTFIRDNSNYSCLSEFLSRAGAICDMPAPSSWLELYNMMLVTQTNGSVELLQVAPLAPGRIPNPRNISDYELLHQLILTGLPFERPAQLLAQMGENSLHVMTVNRQQDFSSHDETLGAAGRAATGFTQQMDYNPISTFAEILGVESSNSIFDSGVNIQNVSDITDFDDSAVLDAGPQTQYRFEWDTTTLHHAQPRAGTIDRIVIEDNPMMYEMDQPNMWENLGGQVTQRQYQLGKQLFHASSNTPNRREVLTDFSAYGKVQDMNMADFFMDTDFRGFPEMALE